MAHPNYQRHLLHGEKTITNNRLSFENTQHAAEWNSKVLKSYDYDYAKAVADQPFSIVTPGSEFRNIRHIEKIWQHHENWNKIKNIITQGVTYPLQNNPPETTRMSDLRARAKRVNHQSALKPRKYCCPGQSDRQEGRSLLPHPNQDKKIFKIKGAGVTSLWVAEQFTISAAGERYKKCRPCNDASFPSESGTSVNLEHDSTQLTPCIYGRCLHRAIHSIHRAR